MKQKKQQELSLSELKEVHGGCYCTCTAEKTGAFLRLGEFPSLMRCSDTYWQRCVSGSIRCN